MVRFVCLFVSFFLWVLWCTNLYRLFKDKYNFIQINSSVSNNSVSLQKQSYFKQAEVWSLNVKTVLFQAIQFSISTQFSSIWPIDRTLWGATTPGQSGLGNNGHEGALCIPKSSSITGTSPSDCFVLYPGHSFGGGGTLLQRSNQCILQLLLTGRLLVWLGFMAYQPLWII